MTTPETQLYLVVAAELELDIKATFKELDRLRSMITHKDAEKLPRAKKDITKSCWTLLDLIDERMDAYKVLIDIIEDEDPPNWRVYA